MNGVATTAPGNKIVQFSYVKGSSTFYVNLFPIDTNAATS